MKNLMTRTGGLFILTGFLYITLGGLLIWRGEDAIPSAFWALIGTVTAFWFNADQNERKRELELEKEATTTPSFTPGPVPDDFRGDLSDDEVEPVDKY